MSSDPKDFAVRALQNKLATSQLSSARELHKGPKNSNQSEALDPKAKIGPAEKKAAEQFEALLLQQMFQSMWENVPDDGMFSSKEEHYFRDMFNENLSTELAKGRGIGIKDVILQEITKKAKAKG